MLYGYRVHGPYEPQRGLRFNSDKLLLDPYARAIGRDLTWHDSVLGYRYGDPSGDLSRDSRDSAAYAPLGAVTDTAFTWGGDQPPRTPWERTVIYEAHVRGLTKLHPLLPPELRGTYRGLASQPVVDHLVGLGVTAVELLPVHFHVTDRALYARRLTNYWGYNTLGFFAPHPGYSTNRDPAGAVQEFKTMVRTLHAAGLEVILDVVYNHTAEGDQRGPTLCFRGIDNLAYYRVAADGRHHVDFTGTGNSLNMREPRVLQLIMDSLRYWVEVMHVDGFRFDLAAALARELHDVDRLAAFFDIIHQDPVLSRVKLIAEPWDVGPGGYQVGNFPVGWSEWNGKFRDTVRRFWKGEGGRVGELASRLAGSSDLYEQSGRRPYASVNFVTCHDGFTLRDLVSYDRKHNAANGENGADGTDANDSWNCGVEGPTSDSKVNTLRAQQQRNLVATAILALGVPMLLAGDELGHTQLGNNNAYCQDNEISWLDWGVTRPESEDFGAGDLLAFVRHVVSIRRSQPVLQRRRFLQGRPIRGDGTKDITWFTPDGREMTDADWNIASAQSLGAALGGARIDETDERGQRIVGDSLVLLLNANPDPVTFRLHAALTNDGWEVLVDTARRPPDGWGALTRTSLVEDAVYRVLGRSLVLLRLPAATPGQLSTAGHRPLP
jgi:glycogen operon protein